MKRENSGQESVHTPALPIEGYQIRNEDSVQVHCLKHQQPMVGRRNTDSASNTDTCMGANAAYFGKPNIFLFATTMCTFCCHIICFSMFVCFILFSKSDSADENDSKSTLWIVQTNKIAESLEVGGNFGNAQNDASLPPVATLPIAPQCTMRMLQGFAHVAFMCYWVPTPVAVGRLG